MCQFDPMQLVARSTSGHSYLGEAVAPFAETAEPPSMAMYVMRIGHMCMRVPHRLVLMAMAVFAQIVLVLVGMRLSQMQHHTDQHQQAAQCHRSAR